MKKTLAILFLALIVVLTFVACDSGNTNVDNGDSENNVSAGGSGDSGSGDSGSGDSGSGDSGSGDSGSGDSDSGSGDSDSGDSGSGDSTVKIKELLTTLLNNYKLDPLSFIPESMQANYSANLVDANDIPTNYSGFVNVSDICYGFGEQWHLVLSNLRASQTFFNVLSVVDGLTTTSVAAFNNYLDNNPADTAHHAFQNGIYSVTIHFDGDVLSYVLDYTAVLPALGQQTVQIALSIDAETEERVARIQLGDANALTYKLTADSYEFAIKYLGIRQAMFSVERDENGNVSGKIYEHLGASPAVISSAAEFYISEDYVSVVGNKADGMIGFTGYICELYDAETGKMLGYEVQESLSVLVFDTLWFNLRDISGINKIKYIPKNGDAPAKVYVNGSSKVWEAQKVSFINTSRRFDIELRTQYVYSYNAVTEEYTEHKIEVPMIFVQEEYYDSLVTDVKNTNNVTLSVSVASTNLDQLLADYDTLLPVFVQNKDAITPDFIITYIGNKIAF